jgi:hypothetical protein
VRFDKVESRRDKVLRLDVRQSRFPAVRMSAKRVPRHPPGIDFVEHPGGC